MDVISSFWIYYFVKNAVCPAQEGIIREQDFPPMKIFSLLVHFYT